MEKEARWTNHSTASIQTVGSSCCVLKFPVNEVQNELERISSRDVQSSLFQTNPLYFIAPMLILLAPDYPMGIYSLIKESI